MAAATKLTPAMEQYHRFKQQHSDAILFFRMGDFYEMFFEDAREASRLLGLTLTKRNHGKSLGDVPLAGVPHHAMEGYLARLIQMGRKVAICEQIEDPKQAKGVVKRDVVQVVSPGTALSDAVLDRQRNNFLVALCAQGDLIGLAVVDLSTGDFSLSEVPLAQLDDELARLSPAELLVSVEATPAWLESLQRMLPDAAVSRADAWQFAYATAYDVLREQLGVQSLKGFDCDDLEVAIRAGGGAIQYLRNNQRGAVAHINRLMRRRPEDHLIIDATAQRNLELLANRQDSGRTHTLLESLDQTCTPMGARLLRRWVVAPLKAPEAINARLDALERLHAERTTRDRLRDLLSGVGDIERMIARICCQRANARDLVALSSSLSRLPGIRAELRALDALLVTQLLESGLPDVTGLVEEISSALVDDPPLSITEGRLIRDGYHAEVDELRQASSGGKEFIAQLQTREREHTGINSLKVGFNRVFGYYIEVSKAHQERVPETYVRKQTLVNAERFITPELKEYEARVLGAEERLVALENELFLQLRQRAAGWTAQVQSIARSLAQIDVLAALAEVAQHENYVRPVVDDSTSLVIEAGRHPVVERQLRDGRFVPNDAHVDTHGDQILLVTGPNMAGKSTIIRQLGIITLMAQMGSFVPARAARIGVVDRIFTRVGASDNLARGESTFMVEMNEAASILNNVTPHSLVLIDELGRGTSTYDGLSIAWAIVEFLHQQPAHAARTLFATHYHEMTQLAAHLERVANFNVQVREEGDHVVFLHRLVPGPSDRSYGIHVAQMAGMPGPVISRAKQILAQLEKETIDTTWITSTAPPDAPAPGNGDDAPPSPGTGSGPRQLELFADPAPQPLFHAELLRMDLTQMTPLQALTQLHEWQEQVRRSPESGD